MFASEIEALEFIEDFKRLYHNLIMDEYAYKKFIERSENVPKFFDLQYMIENHIMLTESPSFYHYHKFENKKFIKQLYECKPYNLLEHSVKEFAFIRKIDNEKIYGVLKLNLIKPS